MAGRKKIAVNKMAMAKPMAAMKANAEKMTSMAKEMPKAMPPMAKPPMAKKMPMKRKK